MPTIGPLTLISDPENGQTEQISLLGLPIGADVIWEQEAGNSAAPPVQLSGLTGDVDIVDLPGGQNIESLSMTGPVGVHAQYADNAGGTTDSTVHAGNIEDATLLEGFSSRSMDHLSVTGPETVDVAWDGNNQGPTSSIGTSTGTQDSTADLFAGPGAQGLSSITLGGLADGELRWADNQDQSGSQTFPIETGEGPASASLLSHMNDRVLDSANIGGISLVDHSSGDSGSSGDLLSSTSLPGIDTLPMLGSILQDTGGLLDLNSLSGLDTLPILGPILQSLGLEQTGLPALGNVTDLAGVADIGSLTSGLGDLNLDHMLGG
jgi:hypothetical protein